MEDVKPNLKHRRRERAQQTRERILRAAHAEFRVAGYHGATMATIAKRAGVAVQTVYFVFHNKAELLSRVVDAAVLGPGDAKPPEETDWYRAMETEPEAAEALRVFIRGAGAVLARAAPLAAVVRDAAATDDEAMRVHRIHEHMREASYRRVMEIVAAKGALRAGLDIDTAVDVLLTVVGDDVYLAFRRDRGWTHERCIDYLCLAVPDLILSQS